MNLDLIEAFLKEEGRPWSLNDIHSKGFKDIPKNDLKNSLDILVKKNKIRSKQNVYCYNFKNHKVSHDVREIKLRINKYSKKVKEKEEEIKNLEEVLNNNNEEIPIPVLEKEHTALTERTKELEIKVDALKNRNETTIQLKPSDLHAMRMKYDTCLREFNKRKIIGVTMLGQIMDIYPKPKQAILEELDVETDEMTGFNISNYQISNNKKIPT
ncbi:uncharacterized protein [Chironomus tepperi]|uniref:uncharacterized protein n=1 Tax=Chironomus tepperi TaxID=113505 RepID=UPI00391F2920